MAGWIFPIGFWFIGTLIAASPGVTFRFIEKTKKKLRDVSDDNNERDHTASIFFKVEEDIISLFPWWWFTLICSILAVFLMAAGFVALSFVLVH